MSAISEREARSQGENAALALRHRLRLGNDPADLDEIAADLGVLITRHAFGDDLPDGMYAYDGHDAVIAVNTSKPPQRQRFTLAHEVGHHELHRFRGPQQIVDVDVYNNDDSSGAKDLDEVAANSFAAHLLLPRSGLEQVVGSARYGKITSDHVVLLVRRYRVSWEMVCNRLRNEGFIRQVERDRLLTVNRTATLAAHGIGPEHYDSGPSLPGPLVQGAAKLWADWVITTERLAQILEVEPDEALSTMAEWGYERRDRDRESADRGDAALDDAGITTEAILAAMEDDDEDDG